MMHDVLYDQMERCNLSKIKVKSKGKILGCNKYHFRKMSRIQNLKPDIRRPLFKNVEK